MSTSHHPTRPPTSRLARTSLAVGFLALAAAEVVAIGNPAVEYELSIYAGTPLAFWIGVALAVVIAAVLAFSSTSRALRSGALLLGGAAMFAIVALPLSRGYFFYGTADPLTHLGWARDIATGVMAPDELMYPGIHMYASLLALFGGVTLYRALMLVTAAFVPVFFLFVPLTVRSVVPRTGALAVGAFAAFLLLPINHVSVHLRAHPFSQTTLFSVLLLFGLFVHVRSDRGSRYLSPHVVLLALVSGATILYHPQLAADVLLVLATLSGVQLVVRRRWPDHPIAGNRPLYVPTVVFAVAFAAWALPSSWFASAVDVLVTALVAYLRGDPGVAGESIATQSASVTAIGAGVGVLFVKLFAASVVFLALGAAITVQSLRDRIESPELDAAVRYLAAGVVVMGPVILLYLLGSISSMYFRHLGFTMVLVTLLGALALAYVIDRAPASSAGRGGSPLTGRRAAALVGVLLLLLVPLTALTVYQSPYIYKANQHVTEADVDGYAATFGTADPAHPIAGIRGGPDRFAEAILGNASNPGYGQAVTGEEVTDLAARFDGAGYLVVSERDRAREVEAYRELRYTDDQMGALDGQVGVDRVLDSGGVSLWFVPESV